MDYKYDRKVLRKLLKALTDAELDEALDDFPAVREDLIAEQKQHQRFSIILDYFEKHQELFNQFLKAIKNCNLTAYENHIWELENPENVLSKIISKKVIPESELLDELKEIFTKEDKLFWQCVKQVYQDFLLELDAENDLEDEPDNLSEVLFWELKKDWPGKTIILGFVARLAAYLSIKYKYKYWRFVKELQEKTKNNIVRSQVTTVDYFTQKYQQFKQEYRQSPDRDYLIIAIKENQLYPDSFQIYGWFATEEIIKNPDRDLIPLENQLKLETEDSQTEEQHYTLDNLKEIVREFLKTQIPKISKNVRELIVEFFLPSSLFGWDVDKWPLETSPEKISLGVVHEVRIRSLDRLNLRYSQKKETWKNKWRSVQKCKNPKERFFSGHCNCSTDTLTGQLQDEQILGLKLRSALKSGHENIASALYYSGTPIALWFRCEPREGDCEAQLNNLLQERLLKLPERVFKTRCQLQHHIFLLWDDPNPILPIYPLQ